MVLLFQGVCNLCCRFPRLLMKLLCCSSTQSSRIKLLQVLASSPGYTLPHPSHPSLIPPLHSLCQLGEPRMHYCNHCFLSPACVLTSGLVKYTLFHLCLFVWVFLPITPVLLCNGNDFHAGLPPFDGILFRKWLRLLGSSPFQFLNRDSVLFHGCISLETTMLLFFFHAGA